MPVTVQSLAREMAEAFQHDRRVPSDAWRYGFIKEAVDALAAHEDASEASASLEPDISTGRLTDWLHSQNSRVYYLSEALTECGPFQDGTQLLAAAQMIEKEEVFQQVVTALRGVLADFDSDESTE